MSPNTLLDAKIKEGQIESYHYTKHLIHRCRDHMNQNLLDMVEIVFQVEI
jgi:hypothetical protein